MQVFAYKMCNFLKKVFQCPPDEERFFRINSRIRTAVRRVAPVPGCLRRVGER